MRPVQLVVAAVLAASTVACANQQPPTAGSPTVLPTTSAAASTGSATTSATSATETTTSGCDECVVVYEASGSGTAITVDYTPDANGAADRIESVPLPFRTEVPVVGSPSVYQIVIVGGDNVGCTITLDGQVVAQEPAGGSAHCVYQP